MRRRVLVAYKGVVALAYAAVFPASLLKSCTYWSYKV
jgi:hypothetical protein